jgi:hypothetical protein
MPGMICSALDKGRLRGAAKGGYMLDRISLDQLRTFIAAVDEGSFSAAGRRRTHKGNSGPGCSIAAVVIRC